MNQEEINKQIFERLERLEKSAFPIAEVVAKNLIASGEKQRTLREIVKGRKFKNGQQQIAVIVGYHENNMGSLINKKKIETEWNNAKMTNKYSKNFLERAKKDLVRVHLDGTCDLTQTGEDFFDKFLKNESSGATSK